ncbi:hypothetical protein BM526_17985 [Alteromonas mediterranea]|uniref:hypothetical protein n=1 Tax=Alteromonas mediterranea TaxID=314275 RepID=UPI0009037821|nr:hypothetical protein [Alteromonas mediterranea]APE03580.1 hypothetical protein BM526_17985 [Alteromonas mediterranea]
MKIHTLLFAILVSVAPSFARCEEVMIIANLQGQDAPIEKWQIRDIFMGNPSDWSIEPVGLRPPNTARTIFNTNFIALTESRIQGYWAQMRFSGRKTQPKEFGSQEEALTYVLNNKNSMTYVLSTTEVPDGLVVIFQ